MRSPAFPRLPAIGALVLSAALLLSSCGERQPPGPGPGDAPPLPGESGGGAESQGPPAGGVLVLPATGQITTSPFTPSSPETRLLSPEEQEAALDLLLNEMARRQAAGLGSGKVMVHGAWHYSGYSYLSPDPEAGIPARMVAVDLTVSGHTPDFDPDDIEIVDGLTQVSYGSDPHVAFHRGPGDIIEDLSELPPAPAAQRMLLLYAFPRGSRSFTLAYWGQPLLPAPMEFDSEGWSLPYPEVQPGDAPR